MVQQAAAILLAFVGPLAFAIEAQLALPRILSHGALAFLVLAARSTCTVVGFIAGRRLWDGDASGWRLVRLWALASALVLVWTYVTPYFPSNRTPSEKRLWLAVWLVVYAGWLVFATARLRRSETNRGNGS